jgi:hypothetical protein
MTWIRAFASAMCASFRLAFSSCGAQLQMNPWQPNQFNPMGLLAHIVHLQQRRISDFRHELPGVVPMPISSRGLSTDLRGEVVLKY